MPRDGANIYHRPPGTDAIADTTVTSAPYNAYVADVEQDLNLPRPIVAGGTGASNALGALTALGGEFATQPITNYDSAVFQPGSFWSAPGATSAPPASVGHYILGTCIGQPGQLQTLIAYDVAASPPTAYSRTWATTWSAWTVAGAGAFVQKAGDTMTGNLAVNGASPAIVLNKAASGGSNLIDGFTNGLTRWAMSLGDVSPESGGNVGSDFGIYRYNDAGAILGTAFAINRATGNLTVNGAVLSAGAGSGFVSKVTSSTGVYYFGDSGGKYLNYDGSNFAFVGGFLYAPAHACRTGLTGTYGANVFNLNYTAGAMQLWVDNSNLGNITVTSDYRIKKDVIDLPDMWDTVKALRPIKYTQADFTLPAEIKAREDANVRRKQQIADGKIDADAVKEVDPNEPFFRADNVERWGFIAHELQDTLIPSASTGIKDSHDHIQSPNPFTVIAALTKALQEAMARIEALEAAA